METLTLPRAGATAAGTIWTIDPSHSTIGFAIKHMAFATVRGRFGSFQGTIRFDRDRPDDAQVEVEIDVASIDTGSKFRDDHLRSADFFDVAADPTISFRSTRVEPVTRFGLHRWRMAGNLTISSVTRAVELAVEQTGEPGGTYAEVIEFAATATISRKAFGIGYNLLFERDDIVIGDEVKITIAVQAHRIPS